LLNSGKFFNSAIVRETCLEIKLIY
jgi:hypothetical protein